MSRPSECVLTAALDIAAHGWPVFILGRTKRPLANCPSCRDTDPAVHDPDACECLTCHGFYAATSDPGRVTAMVRANPRGLLALRTGAPSGRLVVDIDPRNGGAVDPVLMPPTLAVATGNYGWHLYYRHPGHPVLSRKLPGRVGVDIKADGGYVVLPPSIHPDTGLPYQWLPHRREVSEMPPGLADAVDQPPVTPRAQGDPTPKRLPDDHARHQPTGAGGISSPSALLDAHLAAVARAPEGARRVTLYGAARGVARMVIAGALDRAVAVAVLTDAGHRAEQSDRDIRKAIAGGFHAEGLTP